MTFKPGPSLILIPDAPRQAIVHYMYTTKTTNEKMAEKIKIGTKAFLNAIHKRSGANRETYKRIMRFVKRLEQQKEIRRCEKSHPVISSPVCSSAAQSCFLPRISLSR